MTSQAGWGKIVLIIIASLDSEFNQFKPTINLMRKTNLNQQLF